MLTIADVVLLFGGVAALDGVGLEVGGGEVCGLIGPNGVVYVPYYTADIDGGQASAVLFAVALLFMIFLAPSGITVGLGTLARRFVRVRPAQPVDIGVRSTTSPRTPTPEQPPLKERHTP
ncbi:hypothetical protein [Nocardioides sp.]|uniref:hypothetical protein n=1 Tax=Nocardioides sp. TaxID=35761 RepID=UPI0039E6A5CB